jgi:hypothetical protein
MREIDLADFDRAFSRLCAGFDTPPTPARKDAYWQGFRSFTIREFVTAVDYALAMSDEEDMPSVPKLRKLFGQQQLPPRPPSGGRQGPSLQEQLCEYVMLKYFPAASDAKFTPDQMRQSGQPGTYLYREWAEDGNRCAVCTGVLVPAFGALAGFRVNVADMLADPLHQRVLGYFRDVPAYKLTG